MTQSFITIDATSIFVTDAPTLEIIVNGSVVSSIVIDSAFTTTTFKIDYNGTKPSNFSLRFADASGEAGRVVILNSFLISGQDAYSNLSLLSLNQNDSSLIDIDSTDYLYGRINPTNAEMGTPTLEGTNDSERISGTTENDIIRGFSGNDKILAGAGDDRIIGDNGLDHIFGEDGNDIIQSGRHNDRISGGNGNDLIFSHNDNDFVEGDAGNDTINLGAGNDRGFGGADDDIIYGGAGNDRMYGDDGEDRLEGQNGNDVMYGGADDDALYGAGGFDTLYGDAGDDFLNGGNDADKLYGGIGADALRGGNGDDELFGGDGDDDVRGGNHNDELYGGAGVDRIRGEAGDDVLFYDSDDIFWGGSGFDWLAVQETDGSNINFANGKIRDGIEGVSLINENGGALANQLTINAADIIVNSDLDYVFVAGDIGLDSVVSTDYDLSDRVAGGNAKRGGHEYARFDEGGTELFIEVGLTLNGALIT